jgi:hypothetical protein
MRTLIFLVFGLTLAGCYTLSQERFVATVTAMVAPGLPLAQATERLAGAGFECDWRSSAPAITCTRTRQSLLPSTCIERVNLTPDSAIHAVAKVAIAPVMCAGF